MHHEWLLESQVTRECETGPVRRASQRAEVKAGGDAWGALGPCGVRAPNGRLRAAWGHSVEPKLTERGQFCVTVRPG